MCRWAVPPDVSRKISMTHPFLANLYACPAAYALADVRKTEAWRNFSRIAKLFSSSLKCPLFFLGGKRVFSPLHLYMYSIYRARVRYFRDPRYTCTCKMQRTTERAICSFLDFFALGRHLHFGNFARPVTATGNIEKMP